MSDGARLCVCGSGASQPGGNAWDGRFFWGSRWGPSPMALEVAAENALPRAPGWDDGIDIGGDHGIEGFAGQVAVTLGQSSKSCT